MILVSMLFDIMNIAFYLYIIIETYQNYNKYHLHTLLVYTAYYIFGFSISLYVCMVSLLMMYNRYLPKIGTFLITRYSKNNFVVNIKQICNKYNIVTICKYIVVYGNFIDGVISSLITTILNKFTPIHMSRNVLNRDKIEDILKDNNEPNEEELKHINEELDNLLNLGASIIEQVGQGNKNNQRSEAKEFMSNFGKIFKQK